MTIPFAMLTALGLWLLVDGLRPRPPRITLLADDTRPFSQRLLDTLFTPAAGRLLRLGRVDLATHRSGLAVRLAQANYPSPFASPDQVLAYRLFTAVVFALLGGLFGLVIGLGGATLAVMGGLGLAGWGMPDRVITNAIKQRREQLMLDAASTMDRLAIHVAAGNALPMAIRRVAERPGGEWVATFRQVAVRYAASNGDFEQSADDVMASSGRFPEIVRVLERLKAAKEMGGGGTGKALRQMAADARLSAKVVIAERGYQNAVLMVIPAFFAIVAIMIILVAPGAVRMVSVIGG